MAFFKRETAPIVFDNSDCDKMYQYLTQCDFTKPLEVDIPSSSPFYPIVEVLNRAIAEQQAASSSTLEELDSIVQQLTGMTSIRRMLIRIAEQTDHLTSLAAQSEELGASSSQVANSAANSASFVEEATTAAVASGEKIQRAIGFVENSYDEFAKVSQQVQGVLRSMKEIEHIVGVIAGVADQTNLLALNAAIEAARAGEQGRGFAVVADEVRKLAEYTKTSVVDIRQKIEGMSRNSVETANNIVTLTETMQSGKEIMQEAAESLQGIIVNFGSITEDIQTIAASSQEQSAAVQESASSVNTVASASEEVDRTAKVTGQSIYDISKALQALRKDQIGRVPDLATHQALELYKTDHLLWTWRIYNLLLGFEQINSSEVGSHHDCPLGKWADGRSSERCRSLPAFKKLEIPHKRVHDLAYEAAQAIEQGDKLRAGRLLETMSQASQEVVVILQELQQSC
jgi:Methyl-accepting chemotaxis protein